MITELGLLLVMLGPAMHAPLWLCLRVPLLCSFHTVSHRVTSDQSPSAFNRWAFGGDSPGSGQWPSPKS